MRRYTYKARDPKTGEIIKGSIQADDEYAAGKLIVDQGFVPDSQTGLLFRGSLRP